MSDYLIDLVELIIEDVEGDFNFIQDNIIEYLSGLSENEMDIFYEMEDKEKKDVLMTNIKW